MSNERQWSFWKRFFVYQRERFPIAITLAATLVFTFSAVSYSRLSRGVSGFVEWDTYLVGASAAFTIFFLTRIFDEFKDREHDAKYRKYLPVPRGLISLKELRNIGVAIFLTQVFLIYCFQPSMLYLYAPVVVFLLLMGVEFFIPKYLKRNQLIYNGSHLLIFPILDMYSSGLDWYLAGVQPHVGLVFFLAVSYADGFLVEFGRKMRAPEDEEENVRSYTGMFGLRRAVVIWIITLAITMTFAILAVGHIGYGLIGLSVLGGLAILAVIPAIQFMLNPTTKRAKNIEKVSGIWTVAMYLSLGGIPMLMNITGAA